MTIYIIFTVFLYFIFMLQYPKFGVAIYICILFLWPSYIVYVDDSGFGVNPQRILLLVALTVWAMHVYSEVKYRSPLAFIVRENKKLFIVMFLFFLSAIISGLFTEFDKGQAVFASLNQILFILITMILVLTYFNTIKAAKDILFLLVFLSLVVEVFGVKEYFDQAHLLLGFADPSTEYAEKILEGKVRDGYHRISTVFDNPLTYAQFLVFIFPVSLFFLFNAKSVFIRTVCALQLLLLPFNILATGSRAGIGLFLISLIILFVIFTKIIANRYKVMIFFTLIFSFVVVLIFSDLGVIIGGSEQEQISSLARVYQFERGLVAISDSPLIGHGIFQGLNYYGSMGLYGIIKSTDNYYLSVAVERGLLGLVLFLYLQYIIFSLFRKCVLVDGSREVFVLGKYLFVSFFCLFAFELVLSLTEVFSFSYMALGAFLVIVSQYSLRMRLQGRVNSG